MTKHDQLIAELCPGGVPFVPLGEISQLVRGNGLQKKDFTESGVGCIHYGQIYTYYGLFTDKTKSFVSSELAKTLRKVETNDIIITNTSENVEDVCKPVVWLGKETIVTGGHATIIKHQQNAKYLAYFFQTEAFFRQKRKLATGTKVIDVSASSLAKVIVPLPPLPVQHEIVRILDNFAELTAELAAELAARKKQYEYYRDALLRFDATAGERVRWVKLGEVCKYTTIRIDAHEVDRDSYVGVDNLLPEKQGKTTSNYVPTDGQVIQFLMDDLLIGNIRPYLKKIWLAKHDGGTNGDVLSIRITHHDMLMPRFLYYLLSTDAFFAYDMQHSKGAKMPRGDKTAVMLYTIPLPPLEEQARIVTILDRFDALTNDLTHGLPAEIAARKKQYEYYRDRLLSFEEAVS
jgi:type I restriction enzyme, S subunit